MIIAGMIYLAGALGLELAEGWLDARQLGTAILTGFEEAMEMGGALLFLWVLLNHSGGLHISIGGPATCRQPRIVERSGDPRVRLNRPSQDQFPRVPTLRKSARGIALEAAQSQHRPERVGGEPAARCLAGEVLEQQFHFTFAGITGEGYV
jgi:hypothetical protein